MAIRVRRKRGPRQFRLHKPQWIDPFPQIPGTEPEKRVFASLYAMGIYFIYQGQVPEFEKGNPMFFLRPPNYKPDFALPEYRLIIDPFSPFHHALPEAEQRDVQKVAAYSVAGYAYYHPWAIAPGVWTFDQYHDESNNITIRDKRGRTTATIRLYEGVNARRNKYRGIDRKVTGSRLNTLDMLFSIPEIKKGPRYKLSDPRDIKAKAEKGYRIGEYLGAGANAVGAANRRRARPPQITLKSAR